jgi:hypothetical protein
MYRRDQARVDAAIHDPTNVYASPMDVVEDDSIGMDDKKRILDSWHWDAIRLSESEAEAMTGGERDRLREVMVAIAELGRRSSRH